MNPLQLRLTPLELSHAEGYIALLSDPETAAYISANGPLSREAAVAKLQQITAQVTLKPSRIYFAVIEKTSDTFLGYVAAHDLHAAICPISYAILPDHRRKGAAKAAVHLLLHYLSQNSEAAWFEARTHPENTASAATLRSCGFAHAGLLETETGRRIAYRRGRIHPINPLA